MSTDTLLEAPADSESKVAESNDGFAALPPEAPISDQATISDVPNRLTPAEVTKAEKKAEKKRLKKEMKQAQTTVLRYDPFRARKIVNNADPTMVEMMVRRVPMREASTPPALDPRIPNTLTRTRASAMCRASKPRTASIKARKTAT